MQTQDKPSVTEVQTPVVEVGTYDEHIYQNSQATFVIPKEPARRSWRGSFLSPVGVLFLSSLLMVALLSFGLGATSSVANNSASQTSSQSNNSSMNSSSSQVTPSNVPDATQEYGGQLATYVTDPDGAKHFTFTAEQVMWEVVMEW